MIRLAGASVALTAVSPPTDSAFGGFGDSQSWIATAVAAIALVLLLRRALGRRRKGGCDGCGPRSARPRGH